MSDKTKRVSIDVSVNTKNADKSLKDLTKKLDKLSKNGVDIKININRNHYSKQINQFNASITNMVNRVNKDISNIKFNVNTNSAAASVNQFTANLTGAYGRIEKSSRVTSNRMNANFNKSFSSITAMAKGMESSIQSSFTNSFKGINNIVEEIKKSFSELSKVGSEAGKVFTGGFTKSLKSMGGILKSSTSSMGGLVRSFAKLGSDAGSVFSKSLAKNINPSTLLSAMKKGLSFTRDAIGNSNSYGSKLKSQGLRGKLTNAAIDATLPRELGSVVKKLSNSFLEAREDVRNFAKVCRQASDVINSGVIGRKFNRDADKLQNSSNPYKSLAGTGLKNVKAIMDNFAVKTRSVNKVLDPFGKAISSTIKPILSAGRAWTQTGTTLKTAVESKVVNPFNNFGNKLAARYNEFTTKISTSLDKFTDKMSDAADAIRDDEEAKGKGPGFFGKFQDSEGNFSWNKTLDSLDDVYKRLRDVYTQAKQTQQPLMTLANMGFDKASNSLSKGLIKALDDFSEADNNVDKACAGLEAAFYGAGLGAVKTFKKAFNLVPTVAESIKKLGKTLSNVTKIGTKIGKGLINAIKAPFKIARTFINIGKTIAGGISKGIRMGVGLIKSSINFLTGGIIKPVKLLANTISGIISSSLSLAKGTLSGLNAAIVDALSSDGEIELDVKVVGSNKLLGSLFDKRDVSNQLKRDLSLVTRTMPNELGKVTQVFGNKLIDAGNMVRQYANLMIQAYDFVRNNKGVIISTFNKLYSVAAPVVRRVVNALGTILKAAGSKIMSSLASYLMAKIGPLGQLLVKAMTGLHGKFNELLDPSSKLRQSIEAAIPHIINFAKHVKDIAVAIFNAIKHVIDFGKALIDGIAKIVKFVTDIPGNIKKGITKGVDAATDVLAAGFEVVLDKLSSMIDKLSHPIRTIKNASSNLFRYIRGETKRGTATEKANKNSAGTVYGSDDNDTKSSIIVDSNNSPISNTQVKKTVDEVEELKSSLQDVLQVSDNLFIGVTEEQLDSINKSSYQFQRMEEFTRLMNDAVKETDTSKFDGLGAATSKIAEGAKKAKEAFDNIGKNQNLKQATESLKQTGNQAKNLVKNIVDAKLAAQKVDDAFKNLRHPIEALRSTMLSKLGKFDIKLKVQGEKEAIKAATNVANAMNKFKSAKGSDKLAAGFDVAIQSIKYKLTTLKNTMKENFVSNLINKMSGKAKKASKELAENVPGGSKTIGFFKSSLGKLSLLLGGFGIGAYIKQATDLAIKYEASAMQIQNSLGKASQKIMDFAQNSAAALGISQTDAMTYGNKFSLMVRQFEKDTDKIADTTNALMQAAAITASATGTELSTVMDSFQSALTGSSEAVDQYGLNMKIANLEAKLGIDNWNDLTVAQQQFYITQELINQTTANFGNKTLKNTNSMLAQFKAQMSNTSLALGKAFKALLTVVLPYLTAFMKVLENVFNYISTMITSLLSLFGITVDFTSNAASGIEAVGGDIDTSGLDGVSEGMDNAADSADKAAESAEKMKGSLAG